MPKRKPKVAEQAGLPAVIPPPVDPGRIEQVVRWVLAGQREFDIVGAIRETWPDQDVPAVMNAVGQHFLELANLEKPEVIRGWAFAATQEVYRRMLELGDLVGALRAIKQLLEISGG